MNRDAFERDRESRWQAFDLALARIEAGGQGGNELPHQYRLVCQDLALAQERRLGAALVDRLNSLALRGHRVLYAGGNDPVRPFHFLAARFPEAVRREWRLLVVASLLFYGSAALVFVLDWREPDLVYQLLSGPRVSELESMYDPEAGHFGAARDASGNLGAFGYYVRNNVGIGFRTFAGGILLGIGSLFFLVFNGVFLGLAASHLTQAGYAMTFYPFVVGHGAFELTAIVLAGVAGLRLGLALVAPGDRTRGDALRRAGRRALPIVYGFAAMLLVAATIEAFWSGRAGVPPQAKLWVGAGLWTLVLAWLAVGGRRGAA